MREYFDDRIKSVCSSILNHHIDLNQIEIILSNTAQVGWTVEKKDGTCGQKDDGHDGSSMRFCLNMCRSAKTHENVP